jgi:hypothetical protein
MDVPVKVVEEDFQKEKKKFNQSLIQLNDMVSKPVGK